MSEKKIAEMSFEDAMLALEQVEPFLELENI